MIFIDNISQCVITYNMMYNNIIYNYIYSVSLQNPDKYTNTNFWSPYADAQVKTHTHTHTHSS